MRDPVEGGFVSVEGIEADLCAAFTLHKDAHERNTFYLATPFTFGDGDGFTLCFTQDAERGPVLRDHGETMFHLEDWNWTDHRLDLIRHLADAAGAEFVDDELILSLRPGRSAVYAAVEFIRLVAQIDGLPAQHRRPG